MISKNRFSRKILGLIAATLLVGLVGQANAQALNDPAKDGMRNLPRVEGCIAPGGLYPITSSDGPNDAPFWCGVPPTCLTLPVGNTERCTINAGSRNGGLNGVRDPIDLTCVNTGMNPISGLCPLPPTVSATVNGSVNASVQVGSSVTLAVSSPNATNLRQSCAGANSGIAPFSWNNLDSRAGSSGSIGSANTSNVGSTSCTLVATNARGSVSTSVSFNSTAIPVAAPPSASAPTASSSTNTFVVGGVTYMMVGDQTVVVTLDAPSITGGGGGSNGPQYTTTTDQYGYTSVTASTGWGGTDEYSAQSQASSANLGWGDNTNGFGDW